MEIRTSHLQEKIWSISFITILHKIYTFIVLIYSTKFIRKKYKLYDISALSIVLAKIHIKSPQKDKNHLGFKLYFSKAN